MHAAASAGRVPTQKLENNGNERWFVAVTSINRCSGDKAPLHNKAKPVAAENTAMAQFVETDLNKEACKADKWK